MTAVRKFVGESVERLEDQRLLTGRARFADHYPVPVGTRRQFFGRLRQCINQSIDTSLAEECRVAAVITGKQIQKF